MSFRRVLNLVGLLCLAAVGISCGQVYRPVVIPCVGANPVPGCVNTNPPTSGNFHTVFSLTANEFYDSANNLWNSGQGTAMQYDVSGDSTIGVTSNNPAIVSANPTHAAINSTLSRIFVANAGSVITGAGDTIGSFIPENSFSNAISPLAVYSLPTAPPGASGTFPYLPDVVAVTQGPLVFSANYGVDSGAVNTESISVVNTSQSAVTNTIYLGADLHPVSLAETPDASKLYAGTQSASNVSVSNTVLSFNTLDMSQNTIASDPALGVTFPGSAPAWMAARGDSQKIYIVTQGNGTNAGELFTLDVATDTVVAANPVGNGANYLIYDPKLNRIYVTNPKTSTLYVFAASFIVNNVTVDKPQQLAAITIPSDVGCAGCFAPAPVFVTALPDGSRAYVASYQLGAGCVETDPANTSACLVYPQVTVIDEVSNTVKTTVSPLPATQNNAVTEVGSCIASAPYNPGVVTLSGASAPSVQSVRFRVSAAAAADSSRVYVSVCDAQMVATIFTADNNVNGGNYPPDSLVANLPTPPAACSSNCTTPPRQTPVFLLTGQ